ncbi:MAG: hypothetical protein ACTSW1_15675 [Candidatus Hodarchaeales archaeon]
MTIFEDARKEWQVLLSQKSWASPVFGDTYYIRFPIDVGTQEAMTYKQSVFKGDDAVHAFDAKAVRQKIIQRLIEAQERTIRPWYGEVSFFADSMKFLPPIPENELDFVLRKSLHSNDEDPEKQVFYQARKNLLKYLDPEMNINDESSQDQRVIEQAKIYSKCQIELYGLFNITKDRMFILKDTEIMEIIDLLLDLDQADKYLVKRFIEPEKDPRPFVGQENPNVTRESNFLLEYIAGGDREFYPYRVFQLWIRNLLDFDKTATNYIEQEKSEIFTDFDLEKIKSTLLQAIKLHKWVTIKERLISRVQNEYASKRDFSGYTVELIHLLNSRNELFSDIKIEDFIPPIEKSEYAPEYVAHQLAVAMMESIIKYLGLQIPEPEGMDRIQARLIVNKRINNLSKYVLTEELREEILNETRQILDYMGQEDGEKEIQNLIRAPYNKLYPRGEFYFKQMETEVKQAIEQAGDRDLRKELADMTDDPQTLIKQYGSNALRMIDNPENVKELYSTVLALKSTELLFSNRPNLTVMKKQRIIDSLINHLFSPQFEFLHLIRQEGRSETSHKEAS